MCNDISAENWHYMSLGGFLIRSDPAFWPVRTPKIDLTQGQKYAPRYYNEKSEVGGQTVSYHYDKRKILGAYFWPWVRSILGVLTRSERRVRTD